MSQEMKLLEALCDALGFDVEKTIDRQERKETEYDARKYNRGFGSSTDRALRTKQGQMLDIDSDGMYTSYLINPIVSYKLKRRDGSWRGEQIRQQSTISE